MSKIIGAYVSDWAFKGIYPPDTEKLDFLFYSFGVIKDGKVTDGNWSNMKLIDGFISQNTPVKPILSIGGWGAGGFSEAASTKEGLEIFASSAVELVKKHNFKGIDMDWEYPCSSAANIASSPDDKQNFTYMMELLREKLSALGNDYVLTFAVGAGNPNNIEVEKVAKLVDYCNLMTYDMNYGHNNKTCHHTHLHAMDQLPDGICAEKTIKLYNEAGMPKEKLVMGSAFYGKTFEGTEKGDSNGLYQQSKGMGGSKKFTELYSDYINKNGYIRYWDESAKAPYLYNGDLFITYDDEESMKLKAQYVKEVGIAGMMFWEYNEDETHLLLDAIYNEVNNPPL